jgi:hypothetical protein
MKTGSWLALAALGFLLGACSGVSSLGSADGAAGMGGAGGGGTGYEPCANKPCGATCTMCAPGDASCGETAVVKYCDQNGGCGSAFPVCDQPSQCTSDADCAVSLGPCELCRDGSYACPRSYCEAGRCVGTYPTCPVGNCVSDNDCPQVGAPCQVCPDGSAACPGSQCINGLCASSFPGCGGYDPCAGLACGDYCSPCPPDDPTCVAVAVVTYCNAAGRCDTTPPNCSPPSGCTTKNDCPQVEACVPCGANTCAELECLQNKCVFTCPAQTAPECASARDCISDASCLVCADGSCATTECVNGACQRVCSATPPPER